MLFRVNMYRLVGEKRLEAQRRVCGTALIAAMTTINVAVAALFVCAVILAGRGIRAQSARLETARAALIGMVAEKGGVGATEEELCLIRIRAAQVRWSDVMRAIARVAPNELWLPRLRFTDSLLPGTITRVPGLRLSGRLTAGREEEGLTELMEFLAALREDPCLREYFSELKLVDSTWLSDEGKGFLEFDIVCLVAVPDVFDGTYQGNGGWDDDEVIEVDDVGDESGWVGGHGEGAS